MHPMDTMSRQEGEEAKLAGDVEFMKRILCLSYGASAAFTNHWRNEQETCCGTQCCP